MLGRTDSRGRLFTLMVGLIVVSAALMSRLAYWQVAQHDSLAGMAERQTSIRVEVPSRRGTIYDRSGTVVLASTLERDRLVASADQLDGAQRETVITELGTILGLNDAGRADLAQKMYTAKPYVVLARDLDGAASDRIRAAIVAGRISQVSLEPEATRVSPQAGGAPDTSLAAQLLGFVNREGVGQYGIEQRYQDILAGAPKIQIAQRDARSRPVPESAQVVASGIPGADLRLTIDAGLQFALEQELLAAWVADHPHTISAVVMDPRNGEIYAQASYPSYNANTYASIAASEPGRFMDPVISSVYEPGSVMKMLTTVAGLQTGTITLSTQFNDTGIMKLDGGRTEIADADRKAKGWLQVRDGIAQSRNVIATQIALGLAPTTAQASQELFRVWSQFGLGSTSGIDLAGEVSGLVRDPASQPWRQIDLANGSFGQGVAVTQIQLAVAFSAMVNGGQLVQPHVVKAVGGDEVKPVVRRQVMDAALTPTLVDLMNHVVSSVSFYSSRTLIPGYYVGGKTGTAQIWEPKLNNGQGDWDPDRYSFSFVGFVGRQAGQADLVIAVRVEDARPTVAKAGQLEMPVMSFELFRRIATDAITRPSMIADLPPLTPTTAPIESLAPGATARPTQRIATPAPTGGRP